MSSVPAEIAGIGPTSQRLRVTPGFDALRAGLGPEEYFVLSRIDGAQTVRELLLATGLPVDRGIAIVTRLRSIGAVLLPNETPPRPRCRPGRRCRQTRRAADRTARRDARRDRPRPRVSSRSRPSRTDRAAGACRDQPADRATADEPTGRGSRRRARPRRAGVRPPSPCRRAACNRRRRRRPHPRSIYSTPAHEEITALAESVELDGNDRRRVLALRRLVDKQDPHMMLGVSQGADAKQLKRAYFRLSKEIHPDRFYGKRLGSFKTHINTVFEAVSKAYAHVDVAQHRDRHDTEANRALQQQPQTPQEYAAEVFDRACQLEVGGDALAAMKLFAAAVRVDPQPRYLRRATICSLAANQPKSAVEYAKKAQTQQPSDPSAARLLALTFRAVGKLADAEDVLVMAMAMKSENDALMNELRHDLADVRRMLAAAAARVIAR